jgi:hypothetical protein
LPTVATDPLALDHAMPMTPFFHDESGTVRFWVTMPEGPPIGATIGKATLHYRFEAQRTDDDPLATYLKHATEIGDAVRRRVAAGSREPVMLRDGDVRAMPPAVTGAM